MQEIGAIGGNWINFKILRSSGFGARPEAYKELAVDSGGNTVILAQEAAGARSVWPLALLKQNVISTDTSSILCATASLSLLPALSCCPSPAVLEKHP